MTISEQALFLLDIAPSHLKRKKMETFVDLDGVVNDSFLTSAIEVAESPAAPEHTNPFSVASRLQRTNYESHAKSEALMEALKQIRASHATKPRSTIIRGT